MTNYRALGDSITAGTGASDAVHSYIGLLNTNLPTTFNNKGVSTRMALDASTDLYSLSPAPAAGDVSIIMFGVNDEAQYATDATKRGYYIDAVRAMAVYLAAQTTDINTTNATFTGSGWGTAAFGSYASQNAGDTVTFHTTGKSFVIGGLCQYPNAATFSVTVDGVNKGTFSTGAADPTTILGLHYGVMALGFSGLGNGSHTVVCTIVNGGSNGGAYFDWFSSNVPQAKVIINNIPHQNAFVGALANGSNANVDTYNSALAALGVELQGYGLDVTVANICAALTSADVAPDNTHPNDGGHNKIYVADYTLITGSAPVTGGGTGGGTGITYGTTAIYLGSDGNFYVKDTAAAYHQVSVS